MLSWIESLIFIFIRPHFRPNGVFLINKKSLSFITTYETYSTMDAEEETFSYFMSVTSFVVRNKRDKYEPKKQKKSERLTEGKSW